MTSYILDLRSYILTLWLYGKFMLLLNINSKENLKEERKKTRGIERICRPEYQHALYVQLNSSSIDFKLNMAERDVYAYIQIHVTKRGL